MGSHRKESLYEESFLSKLDQDQINLQTRGPAPNTIAEQGT